MGAALAESGLRHHSRFATAALLIGANLPDIDAVAQLWGRDVEMHVRRGMTHGILAMFVLPLALTAVLWLWSRWRRAAADDGAPPFRPRVILALSFLAVWSHPALDWLNTYGVRLLMPFDGRWFYGDTLFIVDPWVWLVAAAGVVLARSRSRGARAGWLLLAALATGLVLGVKGIDTAVQVAWVVGLALVVAIRWRWSWASTETVTRVGLAALVLHVGVAYGFARLAEDSAAIRFAGARQVHANPVPGMPHRHRLVVVHDDTYRVITREGTVHELPRRAPDKVVQAALASESIRGFVGWMRFPYWTVEDVQDRSIVRIWDLRYQGPDLPDARGIGFVRVEVPKGPGR